MVFKKEFKKASKTFRTLTAGTMAFSILVSSTNFVKVAAAVEPADTVKLRVLGTTDIHSNFMDYDYYQDKQTAEFGLAYTASAIKAARAEAKNTLLFDNGDLLQGNPFGDYVAKVKPLKEGELYSGYKAMKTLGYDGDTLGNHEFNYGLDYLNEVLDDAPFSVVNANVYQYDGDNNEDNDVNYFTPYQIMDKEVVDESGATQTLKVGVIGFVPPQITLWDNANLDKKVIAKDIKESAEKFIPKMKEDGADVIIVLAHTGYGDAEYTKGEENAVYQISQIPGVTGIIFGHSHTNFPSATFASAPGADITTGTINGVPAIQPGAWGNNLGVMDLTLEKDANGTWALASSQSKLLPISNKVNGVFVPNYPKDQEIVEAVKAEHEGTIQYVNTAVGKSSADINSYFALVQDDPSVQIVNDAQTKYVSEKLKGTAYSDLPLLSAAAPFKAGARMGSTYYTDIPAGNLAIKNVADLYVYPNTVYAIKITGADVKDWLEMSAGQFNQIKTDTTSEQTLINNNYQTYNYDVLDGVTYEIDVTQPAKYDTKGILINPDANRIVNLKYKGQTIDPSQEFMVATNNYRATGAFPGVKNKSAILGFPDENRQTIIDYIRNSDVINPSADNNWKFSKVSTTGLNVTFTTSPNAKKYFATYSNMNYVETQADGFAKVALDLNADRNVRVQLLGINDFHGQINTTGSVTVNGVKKPVGTAAILATYLKQREATNPLNTLLFSAGDAVGASVPASALYQDEPTIKIFNKLGMDVATVGNHEFDEGVTEMLRLIHGGEHPKTKDLGVFEGANYPYVAANLEYDNGDLVLEPYVIKQVGGIKIGIIGIALSDTPTVVTATGVAGVKFTDEATAINKYTEVLKSKGIKTIVVLAHNPIISSVDGSNAAEELVDIANHTDSEVDVIFGAHNHKYANTTVNGKLLVQAYSYGTAFSDVDLVIDPTTGDVVNKTASIVSTFQEGVTPDSEIDSIVKQYEQLILPLTSQVIGNAATALDRTPTSAGEQTLGNVIADSMLYAMPKAQIAFMNPGGIRNNLDAGDITWGEAYSIQPFGNDLVTVELTGAQIKTILNQQFQPTPKMLQIAGLRYSWDNTDPAKKSVKNVYLANGKELTDTTTYTVVTNNFLADGGDNFLEFKNSKNRIVGPTDLEGLVSYLKSQATPISMAYQNRVSLYETTAPNAPMINPVKATDTTLTGTAEAFSFVHVLLNDIEIAVVSADKDGNFSATLPTNLVGKETINVTVSDLSGNTSEIASITVVDNIIPIVTLNAIKTSTQVISGTTEANSTIVISVNNKEVKRITADANGVFSTVSPIKLVAGNTVTVVAVDGAGNNSQSVSKVVMDDVAPVITKIDSIYDNNTVLKGYTEGNAKIEISVNSKLIGTAKANQSGLFTYNMKSKLSAGTKVSFVAIDASGNRSKAITSVVIDKTAPKINSIGVITSKTKVVTGNVEANSTVTIYVGNKVIGSAKADSKGNFKVSIKSQRKNTTITILVKDAAKNTTKKVVKITK